jgi:hypothetical protein
MMSKTGTLSPETRPDETIPFNDFQHFEGNAAERASAQQAFIDGKTYGVDTRYPNLDFLYDEIEGDGDTIQEKKHRLYQALYDLNERGNAGQISEPLRELWRGFHLNRLKKIMLVEAARHVMYPGTSANEEVARDEYMHFNREVFGEMDQPMFEGIMHTEQERVSTFSPKDERAAAIKRNLEDYFNLHTFETVEQPLMDPEALERLGDVLNERYGNVLGAVPDTPDDHYYDAEGCAEIMQLALEAGDLGTRGWSAEINSKKSGVVVNVGKKKILLPSSTRRNAAELRRLIIHEQEVHARRGQNGEDTGVPILKNGTADYADIEEGLGVLFECAIAGSVDNASYHRARDRYIVAGLALGTDGEPKDGRIVFELTWRLLAVRNSKDGAVSEEDEAKAKKQAVVHVENAFRSTHYDKPGIIYTKLKIYLEGLKKNADYFAGQNDLNAALDDAMIGKYDHTSHQETELVKSTVGRSSH